MFPVLQQSRPRNNHQGLNHHLNSGVLLVGIMRVAAIVTPQDQLEKRSSTTSLGKTVWHQFQDQVLTVQPLFDLIPMLIRVTALSQSHLLGGTFLALNLP